jgi:hypothetical protein
MAEETKYRAAHREAFMACDALMTLVRAEAGRISGHLDATSGDKIVANMFVRSIHVWRAAVELCSDGYGLAAGMLDRPLFEALVDTAWTSSNRAEAERLFDEHVEFSRMFLAKRLAGLGIETPIAIDEARLAEFMTRDRFGDFGQNHWTTKSVRQRLDASRSAFTRDDEWEDVQRGHALAYYWSNQLLHGSSLALGQTVMYADEQQAVFLAGPTDKGLVEALHTLSWTMLEITILALRHFDYGTEADEFWGIAETCLAALATRVNATEEPPTR